MMTTNTLLLLLLLFAVGLLAGFVSATTTSSSPSSCRGEDGQPVDWFVVYKRPAGKSYVYRSSSSNIIQGQGSSSSSWILSTELIDSAASLLSQTLKPLYSADNRILEENLILMYNDELPNGTTSGELHAHAKGVVSFVGGGAQTGFWLIHSVPKFPPSPADLGGYSFPITGTVYGQTFICVTLPLAQADLIGEQLAFYRPFVYHWTAGDAELLRSVPHLAGIASGDHVRQAPWSRSIQLTSSAGMIFTSFAKAREFGLDLYGDWMSGALETSLFVETWTNGQGGPLPSFCSNHSYTVENVEEVRLNGSATFVSHKDHSKWAISSRSQHPWVCVGDINRMNSQRHRGGGSLCFQQLNLWESFRESVQQLESCPLQFRRWLKKKKERIKMATRVAERRGL